jgi:uncharacterized coiled-coil protein SlyX
MRTSAGEQRIAELENAVARRARAAAKYKRALPELRVQIANLEEENALLKARIESGGPGAQQTRRRAASRSRLTEQNPGELADSDDWICREVAGKGDRGEAVGGEGAWPEQRPRKASSIDSLIQGGHPMQDEERHRFLRSVGRVWLGSHCGFSLW